MIVPSLIYIGVTILLALVDAFRIKAVWGKKENIDHLYSDFLAVVSSMVTVYCFFRTLTNIEEIVGTVVITMVSFVFLRYAVYDIALNAFRILTKTNPTLRLDYESDTTSSYVDKHFVKSFWEKRAIGVAGWFVCWIIYHVI